VANVNLQPEHLRSLDLGIKWQGRSVQAELFGFYSRFDDKISSVATGEMTADGRVVVRSENLAEVDLYGLEFGGRWSPVATVKAYATLNWIHGKERDANGFSQPADRVPPLNGRLGVNWEFGDGLHLDTWSDFSSNQDRLSDRDLSDPRINPSGTPGWATLNARVDWQADPTWRFGLTMENLLDNSYREHGSGIDALGINATLLVSAKW
jgi:outer membrane receptor protein involved in Fe transport